MAKSDGKAAMAAVIKYHFWIVLGVGLVAGLGSCTLATGDLASRYNQRKQALDGAFHSAQDVAGVANHPNQNVLDEIGHVRQKQQENIRQTWAYLYKQQASRNPWPDVLGPDFLAAIRSLKPDEEIPETERTTYQTFINTYIPTLKKIVSAKVLEGEPAAGAAGNPAGTAAPAAPDAPPAAGAVGADAASAKPDNSPFIVAWQGGDYARIQARFKDFPAVPSSFVVWKAQEDLWVYQALLGIIRDANHDANSQENAAVKAILHMEIGRDAANALPKAVAAATAPPAEGGAAAAPDNTPAAAAAPALTEDMRKLLDQRYVDAKGRPLAATEHSPFEQFRLMPIHLTLTMDQSKIHRLLYHCATSPMPVEVRLLRILSPESQRAAAPAAGAATAEPAAPDAGAAPAAGPAAANRMSPASSMDVIVDVTGFISIFSPPKEEKTEEKEGAAAESPADAAKPAAPAPNAAK